jgi:6-phosphogluconate dehydrogenase
MPVDQVIHEIVLELSSGDLIVDMGNSHFSDTDRRDQCPDGKRVFVYGHGDFRRGIRGPQRAEPHARRFQRGI